MSPSRVTSSGSGGRVGPVKLARLQAELSARDRRILELMLGHRFLSSRQVEGFCFDDHASAMSSARSTRRVLRRLQRDGLIAALGRRVGGTHAGSSGTIWQLAPAGFRLVTAASGKRASDPSTRFLDHCLAVAEAHLVAIRIRRGGRVDDISVQLEPTCWRGFAGIGGQQRVLKPDLFVRTIATDAGGVYEDRWFVEIDRGTESLATLLGKCAVYEAYRASGVEQHRHGVFPLVAWQLPDEERRDRLQRAVSRTLSLAPSLYRYVLPGGLAELLAGGGS